MNHTRKSFLTACLALLAAPFVGWKKPAKLYAADVCVPDQERLWVFAETDPPHLIYASRTSDPTDWTYDG